MIRLNSFDANTLCNIISYRWLDFVAIQRLCSEVEVRSIMYMARDHRHRLLGHVAWLESCSYFWGPARVSRPHAVQSRGTMRYLAKMVAYLGHCCSKGCTEISTNDWCSDVLQRHKLLIPGLVGFILLLAEPGGNNMVLASLRKQVSFMQCLSIGGFVEIFQLLKGKFAAITAKKIFPLW